MKQTTNSKFLDFMDNELEERKIERLETIITFALIINAIFVISVIIMYITCI